MTLNQNQSDTHLLAYLNIPEGELGQYTPVSSAFAIIQVDEKILLGFNKWRKQWELPAGKLEIGETARQAAARELTEETHQVARELIFRGLFSICDNAKQNSRYRAVFTGKIKRLAEFIPTEADEMNSITLWKMNDPIEPIDVVDLEMLVLLGI